MAVVSGFMVMGLVSVLSLDSHPAWPIISGCSLVACTLLNQDRSQGGLWKVGHLLQPLAPSEFSQLVFSGSTMFLSRTPVACDNSSMQAWPRQVVLVNSSLTVVGIPNNVLS